MPDALSEEDRTCLLGIAREAIVARVRGLRPSARDLGGVLCEHRGAFVTLTRVGDGSLRGCVGYVEPAFPLWETVLRAAEGAATEDSRFDPVAPDEVEGLGIEISVLAPLRPIRPEDVEVGTHGLLIRRSGYGGLLLPQVPAEHGWDRATFLDQVCRKAGLPPGAWRDPRAELLGFTAEVFGEAKAAARP
jgi:AmmeMemoRadiSam system protein A